MPKPCKTQYSSSSSTSSTSSTSSSSTSNSVSMESEDINPDTTGISAPLPKHIPFPEVPHSSEFCNELIMFLFIIFSGGMQFLHIYRTVWWLPDSHMNHTINLYLIDPYLVAFVFVIVSRRILYYLMSNIFYLIYEEKQAKSFQDIAKYIFTTFHVAILAWCTYKMHSKQSFLSLFLLLYPLVVYFFTFGFRIEPYMRVAHEIERFYLNGMPVHCCSTNASNIRDEIDILKNDFNNRCKQIVFTSVINAYYAGFVPCFFAQNFIYFDVTWVTQHIIFVWLGGFTMCTVYCFPAKYCDILHRAALHLGQWYRIDGRTGVLQQPATWSKHTTWAAGSVVRSSGEMYRAYGPATAAVPGNSIHYRFYRVFSNPSLLYMILTGLQTFLVVLQILLLCFSIEWHNILSLSFLTLTNHHTLFKIVRDYLVTQKVYAAESSIYEKLSSHFN